MKSVVAIFAVAAILIAIALGVRGKVAASSGDPVSTCATYSGPAFIGPIETHDVVALHAGQFPGISFVSLDSSQLEEQIAFSQRFLGAKLTPDGEVLTLAVTDASGIRIQEFNVASRKEIASQFFAEYSANLAKFTPDGFSLLGVAMDGSVFRINIEANRIDLLEGAAASAQAIAISADSEKLYIAGHGITVIDIRQLKVLKTLNQEPLLLGIAISPDNTMLAVRDRHSLELLDSANGSKVTDSVIVDAAPDAISQSLINLAFSSDGSQLFYAGTSYVESELIAFSLPALRIEKRVKFGPIASAIAVVPSRRWVLLTSGTPGKEQIQGFDMRTLAVQFQASLGNGGTSNSGPQSSGCIVTSRSD